MSAAYVCHIVLRTGKWSFEELITDYDECKGNIFGSNNDVEVV